MRTTAILFVLSAFSLPLGAADETFDLRGPAPKKGQTIVTDSTLHLKDSTVLLTINGQKLKIKQDMTITSKEEEKFLAVEGRQVIKSQARVLKDHTKTIANFMGEDTTEDKDGDLAGEVIVSERLKDGKWKHTLVDTSPSDDQKKELDKRIGPENDDELFPSEKIGVGHTWSTDASKLKKFFGGSFSDLTGTVKQEFLRLEDVNGEKCAVIEVTGPIKGKMKDDDGDLDFEMDLKATTWRSLKTGIDVKDSIGGKIKMSGKQKIDDEKADIVLDGTLSGSGTTKLK